MIIKITHIIFWLMIVSLMTRQIWVSQSVFALSTTPQASASTTVKSKLQILQDEIASKAAALKQEISKKLQNKAYIGIIKLKSDHTLTIATKDGTKLVTVNQFTEYVGKGKFSFDSILEEDYLAALGDVDDNDILTAKRIVKLTNTDTTQKIITGGRLLSATKNSLTIKGADSQQQIFQVDSDTEVTLNGVSPDQTKWPVDTNLVIIGMKKKDSSQISRSIFIWPNTFITPTSTPSAKPTVTESSPSSKSKK